MINAQQIVEKMKNQKINYDTVLKKMIMQWEKEEVKPKILIHTCCAPCSTHTLEFMSQYAEITLFFSNSNIHPKSEYLRRLHEQKRFVDQFNEKTDHHVALIVDEYRPNEFTKMVLTNHLENEKEGGARCSACFNMCCAKSARTRIRLLWKCPDHLAKEKCSFDQSDRNGYPKDLRDTILAK